jgi:uncharacterized protein YqgC (DUF456 family)
LEAQAHQHLKALLRQEGETRWPHHLTLSRLVARSLRRADQTVVRLAPGSDPSWLLGLLAAFSMLMDFLATTYGAKKLGATWRGMVGAGVGAVLGILWPPLGLLLFPLVGAMLAEMLGGREWREAGKAGIGAAVGVVAGTLGKVACCLGMIGMFVLSVLWGRLVTPA